LGEGDVLLVVRVVRVVRLVRVVRVVRVMRVEHGILRTADHDTQVEWTGAGGRGAEIHNTHMCMTGKKDDWVGYWMSEGGWNIIFPRSTRTLGRTDAEQSRAEQNMARQGKGR